MSDATTISDIRRLWELAYSARQIASALHLPDRLVQHVLQTGSLSDPQPEQLDLFDGQPDRDEISSK